jgi:hypothetical protein
MCFKKSFQSELPILTLVAPRSSVGFDFRLLEIDDVFVGPGRSNRALWPTVLNSQPISAG